MLLNIGERFLVIRKRYDLTQDELSEAIGISRYKLSLIENNKRQLKIEEMIKLCKALKISPNNFLGVKEK